MTCYYFFYIFSLFFFFLFHFFISFFPCFHTPSNSSFFYSVFLSTLPYLQRRSYLFFITITSYFQVTHISSTRDYFFFPFYSFLSNTVHLLPFFPFLSHHFSILLSPFLPHLYGTCPLPFSSSWPF